MQVGDPAGMKCGVACNRVFDLRIACGFLLPQLLCLQPCNYRTVLFVRRNDLLVKVMTGTQFSVFWVRFRILVCFLSCLAWVGTSRSDHFNPSVCLIKQVKVSQILTRGQRLFQTACRFLHITRNAHNYCPRNFLSSERHPKVLGFLFIFHLLCLLYRLSCSDLFNSNSFGHNSPLLSLNIHGSFLRLSGNHDNFESLNIVCWWGGFCHYDSGHHSDDGSDSTCIILFSGPLWRTRLFWMAAVCPRHASSQNHHSSALQEHPAVRSIKTQNQ